jgi:hypothetical protein
MCKLTNITTGWPHRPITFQRQYFLRFPRTAVRGTALEPPTCNVNLQSPLIASILPTIYSPHEPGSLNARSTNHDAGRQETSFRQFQLLVTSCRQKTEIQLGP